MSTPERPDTFDRKLAVFVWVSAIGALLSLLAVYGLR
jgi:hypothetical protein